MRYDLNMKKHEFEIELLALLDKYNAKLEITSETDCEGSLVIAVVIKSPKYKYIEFGKTIGSEG